MTIKKYDDTPYYARSQSSTTELIKPTPQFWNGLPARSFQNPPSQLLVWLETENRKRERGEENEIDIAEIKAAMKGSKNRWYEAYHRNPIIFRDFIEKKKGEKGEWHLLYEV